MNELELAITRRNELRAKIKRMRRAAERERYKFMHPEKLPEAKHRYYERSKAKKRAAAIANPVYPIEW